MTYEQKRCTLDSTFGLDAYAQAVHYDDGTVRLIINDRSEKVNYCPKCGEEN